MRNSIMIIFFISFIMTIGYCEKYDCYGVNSWHWNIGTVNYLRAANIKKYRVMVNWKYLEPERGIYTWNGSKGSDRYCDLEYNILNLRAANRQTENIVKISLCVFDSPIWARKVSDKVLSYSPTDYCKFLIEVLKFVDNRAPGIIESVEIENEYPTSAIDMKRPPVYLTDQRDPSWYYADILKSAYNTIKSYNPKILVVISGIWDSAYHHLDEIYQLGCKGYFDRINLHYYTGTDITGVIREQKSPKDISIYHFPTVIGYLKNIANRYRDNSPIWLTEFGWRLPEKQKSDNLEYILDTCRKSGYVERAYYYVATTGARERGTSFDNIALIYVQTLDEGEKFDNDTEYEREPISYKLTDAYHRYKKFTINYPTWDKPEKLDYIPAALKDIDVPNPGFESGTKSGWSGSYELENTVKYSGNYSMKIVSGNKVESDIMKIENSKLYEVSFWIKVDGDSSDSIMCIPSFDYVSENGKIIKTEGVNLLGIVDTRRYPSGWRKIVFPVVAPKEFNQCRLKFDVQGNGVVFIDEIKISALDLSYLNNR